MPRRRERIGLSNSRRRHLGPILRVDDLVKSYARSGTPAVDRVSLRVEAGSVVGLLGPNGAGKSTSVGCITGLIRPDAGSIELRGRDLRTSKRSIRKHLGLARQELSLYPDLTVADNLRFFGTLAGLRGPRLTTSVADVATVLGFEGRLDQRVRDMSGGQQRLADVACAAVHDPCLLILDEPTAGLDVNARHRVLELVRQRRRRGAAILYSSHYMQEIEEVCDRVVIISGGRIIAEGPVDALVLEHGSPRVEVDVRGVTYTTAGSDVTAAVSKVAELGPIDDVRVHRPSLETVFIDLTAELHDDGPRVVDAA